jgi:hypothetical protein
MPPQRYFQNTAKSAGSTRISPLGSFRPLRSPRRIQTRTVYRGALSHAATSFVVMGVLRVRRWSMRSTLRKYCGTAKSVYDYAVFTSCGPSV